jgi:hypothetical protein
MRRTWTIIAVRDVFSSLKWYQALLGLTQSTPEHDYFGQVLDADVRFPPRPPATAPRTRAAGPQISERIFSSV